VIKIMGGEERADEDSFVSWYLSAPSKRIAYLLRILRGSDIDLRTFTSPDHIAAYALTLFVCTNNLHEVVDLSLLSNGRCHLHNRSASRKHDTVGAHPHSSDAPEGVFEGFLRPNYPRWTDGLPCSLSEDVPMRVGFGEAEIVANEE
jgi:hypothetical protein